jgi:hypothetical protein
MGIGGFVGTADFSPATPVTLTVPTLSVDFGTLTGTDSFVVTGPSLLTVATLSGSGTIDADGNVRFDSVSTLDGRTFNNHAAAATNPNDPGIINFANNAVFNNLAGATFDDTVAGTIGDLGQAGTFNNAGSFTTSAGTGTTVIGVPFNNAGSMVFESGNLTFGAILANSGDVTIASGASLAENGYSQTNGATMLDGATLTGGPVAIGGGTLTGSGTINANVTNGGQVIPGGTGTARVLTINGNYTQTSTGALDIDIGGTTPGTQYDQLAVSGAASLGGTMNISLINAFQPAFGNSFQVLTFGSSAGNFATYTGTSLASGLFLDPAFNPTNNPTNLTLNIDRVSITGAPAFPLQGNPINLAAFVTGPSAGDSFAYAWNVTQNGNPFSSGSGATFTFTPNLSATYLVTFGVTDVIGGKGTVTLSIVVIPSIFVLDPKAGGALTISGNASINIPGEVAVDSSSSSAISVNGNASVTAASVQVVGNVKESGNASLSPAPVTGAAATPDPFATLSGPSTTGLTNYGAKTVSGNSSLTICQGIYSQITAAGNAKLTMNPGTYIIEGGGLTVTGNASVTGTDVFIYNAGSNYPNSGGNFGGITLSGDGTFSLSAPTSGPYAGILIFQSRQNTRAFSFSGNAASGMAGAIYAPSALVSLSGNAQIQNSLIVDQLNVSGNVSLTQMAAGSDGAGDTSGIANTLLAGNLFVYINDLAGLFTSAELARIQGAINAWDAILAPYNVIITEVSDPSQANIVIDTNTTSACGGMADGVLGCYNEPNNEITLIQGWNWYAGADPSQIGAVQYDFETTVLHELGHALGLGGSNDPTSPMYETLASGGADRTVTVADLNIPDPPAGADPQRAAGFRFDSGSPTLASGSFAAYSGPSLSLVRLMPLTQAVAGVSGQWSTVTGGWPVVGGPAGSPIGPEPTLVVQGHDEDNGRELALSGPEAVPVRDSALAHLVTDADHSRGEDAEETSGVRVLPGSWDVPDDTGPERIRSHPTDPGEFVRPVEPPLRVRPVERDLIAMDSISDALLDELAVAAIGLACRLPVPADSIARPESPQESGKGLAKLAATLIFAGSWGHRAHSRGVTSGPVGRPRYRKDPE